MRLEVCPEFRAVHVVLLGEEKGKQQQWDLSKCLNPAGNTAHLNLGTVFPRSRENRAAAEAEDA